MATTDAPTETFEQMEETLGLVPPPMDEIPEDDAVTEWPYFEKYTVGESEIPAKYRELMGLAAAANIKCPYCTYFHRKAAKLHGATDAELEETVSLASFTSRYSAMLHAADVDLDDFKTSCDEIEQHLTEHA